MANCFPDSVADFDLNFLHPSHNVINDKSETQHHSIITIKKRIVASNTLLESLNFHKKKNKETENLLIIAKEECKRICIENKETLEKCAQLERDKQKLKDLNQDLEDKNIFLSNQCDAMKSHAHQLQSLVKEKESSIEAHKLKYQHGKSDVKDYEKQISTLEKEKYKYLKDIQWMKRIILGHKKLTKFYKNILLKYDKCDNLEDTGDLSDDSSFDDPLRSPLYTINSEDNIAVNTLINHFEDNLVKSDLNKIENNDDNLYFGNEVVSEDTGRGSSLALSETDKNFGSPEDFTDNDHPTNIIYVDAATSPMRIENELDIISQATLGNDLDSSRQIFEDNLTASASIFDDNLPPSPNVYDDEALLSENPATLKDAAGKSPEYFIMDIPLSTEVVTIKEKIQLADACTSPVNFMKDMVHEATSPIIFDVDMDMDIHDDNAYTAELVVEKPSEVNLKNNHEKQLSSHIELEISQDSIRQNVTSESINTKLSNDERNNDNEVATILNNMRLQHELISPIPQTPGKPLSKYKNSICISPTPEPHNLANNSICQDALKIRAETKTLHENVEYLSKEIINIKNILKNNFLTPITHNKTQPKGSTERIFKKSSLITSLFDDDTNESIISDHFDLVDNDPVMLNIDSSKNTSDDLITCKIVTEVESHSDTDNKNENSNREDQWNNPIIDKSVNALRTDKYIKKSVSKTTKGLFFKPSIRKNKKKSSFLSNGKNNNKKITQKVIEEIKTHKKMSSAKDIEMQVSDTLCFENNEIQENEENGCLNGFNEKVNSLSETRNIKVQPRRARKQTKLNKFMNKLRPKSKIQRAVTPPSKISRRLQRMPILRKDLLKPLNILNNKDVYQKAAKVMAQINMKNKPKDQTENVGVKSIEGQKINEESTGKHDAAQTYLVSPIKYAKDIPSPDVLVSLPLIDINTIRRLSSRCSSDNLFKSDKTQTDSLYSCMNKKKGKHPIKTRSRRRLIELQELSDPLNIVNDSINPENVNNDILNCSELTKPKQVGIKRVSSDNNNSKTCKRLLRSNSGTSNDMEKETSGKATRIENVNITNSNCEVSFSSPLFDKNDDKKETSIKTIPESRRSQRLSINYSENSRKMSLRSSNVKNSCDLDLNLQTAKSVTTTNIGDGLQLPENELVSYNDLDLFSTESEVGTSNKVENDIPLQKVQNQVGNECDSRRILRSSNIPNKNSNNLGSPRKIDEENSKCLNIPRATKNRRDTAQDEFQVNIADHKQNILCKMIEKYGQNVVKLSAKKVPDKLINPIYNRFEKDLAIMVDLPQDKAAVYVKKLVEDIVNNWTKKQFMTVLLKFLQDPSRKLELFNKINFNPGPPMTKREYYILLILNQLHASRPNFNIVNDVLNSIDFVLFQLNKSPDFDTIDTLSHFYAVVCRYFLMKNRLRTFLLDAMYCLQFKSVSLIKQCLSVWMHILPLAHMEYAKSPLITCIVYLLHFYKCEDRFNKLKDIRYLLSKKYFFTITEWNEPKMLEMFTNAINSVRDNAAEQKMLRIALLIVAKRHGPKWCQKNIINNTLLPIIEKESTSQNGRIFCIKMLGPLLKPYPVAMKVHCEIIVNQLIDMLDQQGMDYIKEAIFYSLIFMNKHNSIRVAEALLSWQPRSLSTEFESLIKDFVREKPIHMWKNVISQVHDAS